MRNFSFSDQQAEFMQTHDSGDRKHGHEGKIQLGTASYLQLLRGS